MNITEIKIEPNIPIPCNSAGRPAKYPFAEMEIGDSIFLPGRTPKTVGGSLARQKVKSGGIRSFKTRTVIHNGVKGVRIWRVT